MYIRDKLEGHKSGSINQDPHGLLQIRYVSHRSRARIYCSANREGIYRFKFIRLSHSFPIMGWAINFLSVSSVKHKVICMQRFFRLIIKTLEQKGYQHWLFHLLWQYTTEMRSIRKWYKKNTDSKTIHFLAYYYKPPGKVDSTYTR